MFFFLIGFAVIIVIKYDDYTQQSPTYNVCYHNMPSYYSHRPVGYMTVIDAFITIYGIL